MSQAWRRSREYRLWRAAVIRRDGVCQNCGRRKDRHAHHIEHAAHSPELRFDVENGLTLCQRCHWMLHYLVKRSTRFKCAAKDVAILRAVTGLLDALPEKPSHYRRKTSG